MFTASKQRSPRSKTAWKMRLRGLGFPARAHDRIRKVARTIADLDGDDNIESRYLSEAIQYRILDRSYWA